MGEPITTHTVQKWSGMERKSNKSSFSYGKIRPNNKNNNNKLPHNVIFILESLKWLLVAFPSSNSLMQCSLYVQSLDRTCDDNTVQQWFAHSDKPCARKSSPEKKFGSYRTIFGCRNTQRIYVEVGVQPSPDIEKNCLSRIRRLFSSW